MAYCHTSNSRADRANPAAAKAKRGEQQIISHLAVVFTQPQLNCQSCLC